MSLRAAPRGRALLCPRAAKQSPACTGGMRWSGLVVRKGEQAARVATVRAAGWAVGRQPLLALKEEIASGVAPPRHDNR